MILALLRQPDAAIWDWAPRVTKCCGFGRGDYTSSTPRDYDDRRAYMKITSHHIERTRRLVCDLLGVYSASVLLVEYMMMNIFTSRRYNYHFSRHSINGC